MKNLNFHFTELHPFQCPWVVLAHHPRPQKIENCPSTHVIPHRIVQMFFYFLREALTDPVVRLVQFVSIVVMTQYLFFNP